MTIGYAEIGDIVLTIQGSAVATPPNKIYITDVTLLNANGNSSTASENAENLDSMNVNVVLGNDTSSTVTFSVTMINKTSYTHYYKNTAPSAELIASLSGTQNNIYNNSDIKYTVSGLTETTDTVLGTALAPGNTINFTVTFSYADGVTPSVNTLKALMRFEFSRYYTITYNANGGSGGPGTQLKPDSTLITLSTTQPTRIGFDFVGWASTPDATTPEYNSGSNYNLNADKTLYAVWQQQTPTINQSNWTGYIGKVVTNYKTITGDEAIYDNNNDPNHSLAYNVSTQYRLYYIDYANKYGDGAGTIYLKADYPESNSTYQVRGKENSGNSKAEEFNPLLYSVVAEDQFDLQSVIWLLDQDIWDISGLKTNINPVLYDKVNYVVAAPSVELMMDSYNACYNLQGDSPDTSRRDSNSPRTKLFYSFPYINGGNPTTNGYGIGPGYFDTNGGYYTHMKYYTIQAPKEGERNVGSLYNPLTSNAYYWIASPAADSAISILRINSANGGHMQFSRVGHYGALCPIVSLQADAPLEFAEDTIVTQQADIPIEEDPIDPQQDDIPVEDE